MSIHENRVLASPLTLLQNSHLLPVKFLSRPGPSGQCHSPLLPPAEAAGQSQVSKMHPPEFFFFQKHFQFSGQMVCVQRIHFFSLFEKFVALACNSEALVGDT